MDNEIPLGTRAVMFCFTCDTGTPRVTFDMNDIRWTDKSYAELESIALAAVFKVGYLVHDFKAHFIP